MIAVATALSALAAWAALGLSLYNAYARWKDRTPRVELAAGWNLPRDAPEASKGPGHPATADPFVGRAGGRAHKGPLPPDTASRGGPIFQCEITNIGIAGVKIKEVYVYLDAPSGKPVPMYLSQDEQPRKLDNGDSQTWLAGPFDYDIRKDEIPTWAFVLALDTVGNMYRTKNPAFSSYSSDVVQ